jgi:hypothetical protein
VSKASETADLREAVLEQFGVKLPTKWVICSACRGEGSRALGGQPVFDMDEWDEDSIDDYFGGRMDTRCDACEGSGKTPEIDFERIGSANIAEWVNELASHGILPPPKVVPRPGDIVRFQVQGTWTFGVYKSNAGGNHSIELASKSNCRFPYVDIVEFEIVAKGENWLPQEKEEDGR